MGGDICVLSPPFLREWRYALLATQVRLSCASNASDMDRNEDRIQHVAHDLGALGDPIYILQAHHRGPHLEVGV